eukprot:TRINITY_DN28936_c0_g1_i1.p1 TRINITY_DN28936_c0_g1~~TRINITY_DN28936_c0_g1_i1.p1  ORF type:complete len:948 (-),score=148.00 TRINITY_DN28936_c0_g1_i1:252-3095(-)
MKGGDNYGAYDWRKKLDFSKRALTDTDVGTLDIGENFRHCEELDFSCNKLTSVGLRELLHTFWHCKKLRVLKLFKNQIDDRGAAELVKFVEESTAIQEIHLSHNMLTSEGVWDLVTAAEKSRSSDVVPLWLRLERNAIEDPQQLLQKFERDFSVCGRYDERLCTPRTCCKWKKVHLPFFGMQTWEATVRNDWWYSQGSGGSWHYDKGDGDAWHGSDHAEERPELKLIARSDRSEIEQCGNAHRQLTMEREQNRHGNRNSRERSRDRRKQWHHHKDACARSRGRENDCYDNQDARERFREDDNKAIRERSRDREQHWHDNKAPRERSSQRDEQKQDKRDTRYRSRERKHHRYDYKEPRERSRSRENHCSDNEGACERFTDRGHFRDDESTHAVRSNDRHMRAAPPRPSKKMRGRSGSRSDRSPADFRKRRRLRHLPMQKRRSFWTAARRRDSLQQDHVDRFERSDRGGRFRRARQEDHGDSDFEKRRSTTRAVDIAGRSPLRRGDRMLLRKTRSLRFGVGAIASRKPRRLVAEGSRQHGIDAGGEGSANRGHSLTRVRRLRRDLRGKTESSAMKPLKAAAAARPKAAPVPRVRVAPTNGAAPPGQLAMPASPTSDDTARNPLASPTQPPASFRNASPATPRRDGTVVEPRTIARGPRREDVGGSTEVVAIDARSRRLTSPTAEHPTAIAANDASDLGDAAAAATAYRSVSISASDDFSDQEEREAAKVATADAELEPEERRHHGSILVGLSPDPSFSPSSPEREAFNRRTSSIVAPSASRAPSASGAGCHTTLLSSTSPSAAMSSFGPAVMAPSPTPRRCDGGGSVTASWSENGTSVNHRAGVSGDANVVSVGTTPSAASRSPSSELRWAEDRGCPPPSPISPRQSVPMRKRQAEAMYQAGRASQASSSDAGIDRGRRRRGHETDAGDGAVGRAGSAARARSGRHSPR